MINHLHIVIFKVFYAPNLRFQDAKNKIQIKRRWLYLNNKLLSEQYEFKFDADMTLENLRNLTKEQITDMAQNLTERDVQLLMEALSEKDNQIRFHAFLLLQAHSRIQPTVYDYWTVLVNKLVSDNSYQRSLGVMLIAENVRWDKEAKFRGIIEKYFACCADQKFITSRQAIQGLGVITASIDDYNDEIRQRLMALDLRMYKETQQKLLRKDIATVVMLITK